MTDAIPNTPLTAKLRVLWEVIQEIDGRPQPYNEDEWQAYYWAACEGGTPNARACAAVAFYRAQDYWPDFFSPMDLPAVAILAKRIDEIIPGVTPAQMEKAVDWAHSLGRRVPPRQLIDAALDIQEMERMGGN